MLYVASVASRLHRNIFVAFVFCKLSLEALFDCKSLNVCFLVPENFKGVFCGCIVPEIA